MDNNFPLIGDFHEQNANIVIAEWLDPRGAWEAQPERVGTMQGSQQRPDIILQQQGRMPVIIENEYGSPAVGDAKSRLGGSLTSDNRPFTEIIALGTDESVKGATRQSLTARLDANERIFTVQFVSGEDPADALVWPAAPLSATPADLVAYCEYAQAPQSIIDAKSDEVAVKIRASGRKLHDAIRLLPNSDAIHSELMQSVGVNEPLAAAETVCAIWMIAIDLQNDLATYSENLRGLGLKSVEKLGTLTKSKMLAAWKIIEKVNYLPVVEMSIPCLQAIPARTGGLSDVLYELAGLSDELNALNAKHIYNFAGELWQKLDPEREERASHYTKPTVAELLATLGAVRFGARTAPELSEIDIMDAACGTGTLVGAGERALRRLHRLNGGDADGLHRNRMENHIIAIDVNSIAGTLTAKRLTDMAVEQTYNGAKIAVTDHEAGSLSLLDPRDDSVSKILGFRDVTEQSDENGKMGLFHIGTGEESTGVDYALMNPPYSRPRKDRIQAAKGLDKLRAKAKRAGYLMSHGQAGLASDFGNLSLMRLKPGGVFAHVLPLTAAHSESWQAWRREMETHFEDIVALANVGDDIDSMSADTNMNEMLVVATRRKSGVRSRKWEKTQVLCVNLLRGPHTLAAGYAIANEVANISSDEENGQNGNFGFVRADTLSPGFPWYAVGNANLELTAVTCHMMRGKAYNPLTLESTPLALAPATLQAIGKSGPTHHLLGHAVGGDNIGAFGWTLADSGAVSGQRSMWSAESKTHTRILTAPTHSGQAADKDLAKRMVAKRGQWFISRGLRWTSQPLAFAHTRNKAHGGAAWNAIQDISEDVGRCVALFYNSVFGAIIRQAYGQSTQRGRATVQVKAIEGLPCPDFGASTAEGRYARSVAKRRFPSLAEMELEPFAFCFRDKARHEIDNAVAEMLGLNRMDSDVQEMLAHWRLLFVNEPNVNGGNKRVLAALAAFNGSEPQRLMI